VQPGGQASLTVTVFNPSTLVEGYDLDVVSATPLTWASVTPPTLSVYPQQEGSAVVTFLPPSGPGAPGGSIPFGVRVCSQRDTSVSAVAEGDLDVGGVAGLQATLTPTTSSGRWSGRHTVRVGNWGNVPARLRIAPQDADQALGFLVSPQVVDVPLGGEAVARLKVRTRRPVLRGSNQRLAFQVVCEPEVPQELGAPRPVMSTPERPVVDGAFNQKPILTRAVVTLAGVLLLAGIGGVAWAMNREKPVAAEAVTNPDAPTGVVVEETTSPDTVVVSWKETEDVDSYKLYPTDREAERRGTPLEIDGGATSAEAGNLLPDSEVCFVLVAIRGDKPSPYSEPACGRTEPAGTVESTPSALPTPEATVTPDMGSVTETPSPTAPTTGTSSPTDQPTEAADAPPLPFISVLDIRSPDRETDARAVLEQLSAAGVQAKLLPPDLYGLRVISGATPTDPPAPQMVSLWLVYVDAPTAAEATAVCRTAAATAQAEGVTLSLDACLTNYEVVTRPTPTSEASTGTNG